MYRLPKQPLQAMIDGWSSQRQKERAATQMTLGKLIAALEALPSGAAVQGFGAPMSYRGYYKDLAFAPAETEQTVGDLLATARDCMGCEFTGYKGGEFMMGERTPVWIAAYGDCGDRLMGLTETEPHRPITAPDDDDR